MEIRKDPDGYDRFFIDAPELAAQFEVNGACPVQGTGSVLERDLYFRARGETWSFDVADHMGKLPSDGAQKSDGFYREGDYPNAGYMPLIDAVKIIVRCLEEYTGVRAIRATQP